jgi:hypothetical protein
MKSRRKIEPERNGLAQFREGAAPAEPFAAAARHEPRRPRIASPELVDESSESEILIQPDGRVFAFGITGPLAAVLATLPTSDDRTKRLLERIRNLHLKSGGGR